MTIRALSTTALVSATVVGLLVLGGCGGGSGSSAAAPSTAPDSSTTTAVRTASSGDATSGSKATGVGACALVTEADATTALGSPAGAGVLTTQGGSSRCVYGTGKLIVTSADVGKTGYEQGRNAITAAPAGTWKDLSDLGDAGFTAHGGPVVSVEFYKGATLVAITLSGSSTSVPTDAAVAVAHAAAARI